MLVGTVGILVPAVPGLVLVWLAALLWATEQQTRTGWSVLALATVLYAAGLAARYVVPGRRMRAAGVDTRVVAVAAAVALVGFFVVPVLGAPLGFVGAIYLLERRRQRSHAAAWTATVQALRAVGLSMGIELATAAAITATWVAGVVISPP